MDHKNIPEEKVQSYGKILHAYSMIILESIEPCKNLLSVCRFK